MYPLLDFLEFVIFLPALVLVDLLAQRSVYPIIDHYLPHTFTLFTALRHIVTFVHFSVQVLRCFIALLYIVTSRHFHFTLLIFHVHCRILTLISCSVMVGWSECVFVFVRHTSHCFFLLVNCILCG